MPVIPSPIPKLDDCLAPDNNTDLNASTNAHGLMQKYPGGTTTFLRSDGAWGIISTPRLIDSTIIYAANSSVVFVRQLILAANSKLNMGSGTIIRVL